MGKFFHRDYSGRGNYPSFATAGDKMAAKHAMRVISPIIIVCMIAWTICAIYFMNMIFTKVGTANGIILPTPEEESETPSDTPTIIAAEAIRMVCESGKYRYDFYQDNSYELAYVNQTFNLESGTYTIAGEKIALKNKDGAVTDASYAEHVLIIEHDTFNCKEYNGR
jgi:hypothetical protein